MAKKNQSGRLTIQHKEANGVIGIFGEDAQVHDYTVAETAILALNTLKQNYPKLEFRHRRKITKKEINMALSLIDSELGQTLFVEDSCIKPDGGIIEVKDDNYNWRVVLVSEAKCQGKDIDNIKHGTLVGTENNQELMIAGNAIERAHKNISEIANFMLAESYFPYVLFLEGSNFLTHNVTILRPDGSEYTLNYNSGTLNRLDRLTSANYGLPINKNLCKNKTISCNGNSIMLQATSIYTQGSGEHWLQNDMLNIMLDVANTSLQMLGSDLFKQLTGKQEQSAL